MDELRRAVTALVEAPPVGPPSLDDLAGRNRRRHARRRATVAVVVAVLVAAGSLVAVNRKPSPDRRVITTPAVSDGRLAVPSAHGVTIIDEHQGVVAQVDLPGSPTVVGWSPNGRWLAVQSFDHVWFLSRDGATKHELTLSPLNEMRWLPRGSTLVVASMSGVFELEPGAPARQVGPAAARAWPRSPDGRQLARQDADGIHVSRPDGSDDRLVARYRDLPDAGEGIILHDWSPDGRWLLYWAVATVSASIQADGLPLYAVPADGGAPFSIGVVVDGEWIQWSPDARTLLVAAGAGRFVTDRKVLRTCVLTTRRCTDLSQPENVSSFDPAWSPDGTRVAAVRVSTSADLSNPRGEVWVMDADGTHPVRPDAATGVLRPMWVASGAALLEVLASEPLGPGFVAIDRHDLRNGSQQRLAELSTEGVPTSGGPGYVLPPLAWSPKAS